MEIGAAKVEIPVHARGIGMFGWGVPGNFVEGSATPISARAFVLRADAPANGEVPSGKAAAAARSQTIALVSCELLAISLAVREAVHERLGRELPELGLERRNVLLTATHTHSAPGGYSQYAFYALEAPGFSPLIFNAIVGAIIEAIRRAAASLAPGMVRFACGTFCDDEDVAFNRSIASYNQNPEVEKLDQAHRHLALDRRMRMLRFDRKDGRCIGEFNFFGVHGTSVHSDNRQVHFDNKGYAAALLEADQGGDFVGAFAQGTTGDVTPNFKTHAGKPFVRGMYADDDASAQFNGNLQFRKAAEVLKAAAGTDPLGERLLALQRYSDLADIGIDPEFANGRSDRRTGPGELGMAMFFGTDEGPGMPRRLLFLQRIVAALRPFWRLVPRGHRVRDRRRRHDAAHGVKVSVMEMGRRSFLGFTNLRRLPTGKDASPAVRMIPKLDQHGLAEPKPWTPNILPAQLLVIGNLAIAAVPHELTTIAGRRLETILTKELAGIGVEEVIVAGYANGYAGYVTTPEEYELQDYEGASTHFGQWTLPAWQTIFRSLAGEFSPDAPAGNSPEPLPPTFTAEDLEGRIWSVETPPAV
jgi:neutral ceramidase